jgi:hypothetical protein
MHPPSPYPTQISWLSFVGGCGLGGLGGLDLSVGVGPSVHIALCLLCFLVFPFFSTSINIFCFQQWLSRHCDHGPALDVNGGMKAHSGHNPTRSGLRLDGMSKVRELAQGLVCRVV